MIIFLYLLFKLIIFLIELFLALLILILFEKLICKIFGEEENGENQVDDELF